MTVKTILLENQTTGVTAGSAKQNNGVTSSAWNGGERLLVASGTFDGCTVGVEFAGGSPHSGYVAEADLQFTEPGLKVAWLPGKGTISASLTNAGAGTNVTLTVQEPGGQSQ